MLIIFGWYHQSPSGLNMARRRNTGKTHRGSESLLRDAESLKGSLSKDLKGSTAWIRNLDSIQQERSSNKIHNGILHGFIYD